MGEATDRFWLELEALYQAAGRPTLSRLVRLGREQRPEIVISDSTINGWLNRKTIPTGPKSERYLFALLAFLRARAKQGSGYEPLPSGLWPRLLHQARAERAAAKKSGRPRQAGPSKDAGWSGQAPTRVPIPTMAAIPGVYVPAGQLSNAGIQFMAPYALPAVRSGYLEQVRQIAPDELLDRDEELAELARFCTLPSRGPYIWLRAPAWSGKSALLSWFVLHPPSNTRVVSFFVTARYAGQDDRVAFTDVVLEQVLEILEQPMPSHLTDSTRGPYLLRKLAEAAGQSEQREERLVLVVDGLDEDRGVMGGPDAHSIAALLPFRPSPGLRIILASRPEPPIPVDVPDNHPLRDPAIAHPLRKSQWAEVVRSDMQRELKRLLHGTRTEQDLLGLVTAAGGGLSGPDLAELTSLSGYEIEETLHAVVGRTFISRPSPWNATNAPPVYVLGHEELQIGATAVLGDNRLQVYRHRLHAWARSYWEQGWPMGTPEYLLRGYFRMLRAIKDIPRLVAYATDLALRDRMLDVTGGDAAALANIADAQAAVVSSPEPDLLAMTQLAIHRTNLLTQNANIPEVLATVWAIVGYRARADALAFGIPDPFSRASALSAIAKVAAGEGDTERAERILERALTIANGIINPFWRAEALVALVEAEAVCDLDRAQSAARLIVDPVSRVRALAVLTKAAAGLGNPERMRLLLDEAEDLIPSVINLTLRARALAALVEAAAEAGDTERVARLSGIAESLVHTVSDPILLGRAQAILGRVAAAAGNLEQAETFVRKLADPVSRAQALAALAGEARHREPGRALRLAEQAETLARSIPDPARRAKALALLARELVGWGDPTRAEQLAERAEEISFTIPDPSWRAEVLAVLARVSASAGDRERARRLAEQAETMTRSIPDPTRRTRDLTALVRASARAGDLVRARRLADLGQRIANTITNPRWRAEALAALAVAAAEAGQIEKAEQVARAITDPFARARAFAAVIQVIAVDGQDHASKLADRADVMATVLSDPFSRAEAMAVLEAAAADGGDLSRAEAMTITVTDPFARAQVLAAMVAANMSDADYVRRLAVRGERLTSSIRSPGRRAEALTALARAAAEAGYLAEAASLAECAEEVAREVRKPLQHAQAFAVLAEVAAAMGTFARAEVIARTNPDPVRQGQALAVLAKMAADARYRTVALELVDRAEKTAEAIIDPALRVATLVTVAQSAVIAGNLKRAQQLADQMVKLVITMSNMSQPVVTLAALVPTAASAGEENWARGLVEQLGILAHTISNSSQQAVAFAAVAQAAANVGDLVQAERLANAIPGRSRQRAVTLAAVAQAAANVGDLVQAERLANAIPDRSQQRAVTFAAVAQAAANVGDLVQADRLASAIQDSSQQATTFAALAQILERLGDERGARKFTVRAEEVAQGISDLTAQTAALLSVARQAEPKHAHALLARTLMIGDWTESLDTIAQIEPSVFMAIAAEYEHSISAERVPLERSSLAFQDPEVAS